MITERTLKRWRKEALETLHNLETNAESFGRQISIIRDPNERILRMTQELLDAHLIRKK